MTDNTSMTICVSVVCAAFIALIVTMGHYHVEKTRTEAATEQLRITLRPTCPKPVVAVEAP